MSRITVKINLVGYAVEAVFRHDRVVRFIAGDVFVLIRLPYDFLPKLAPATDGSVA